MSNYSGSPTNEKPQLIMTIAIMTLISGILNILWGLGLTAAIVLGTFFLGIVCAPVTILPVALGIFEVIYALKLLSDPPQPVQPSQPIAVVEIVSIITGNVISAGVGVLALILYNDPIVKGYFARINGQIPPAPPVVPEPAAPSKPVRPKAPAPKPKPVKKVVTPKEPAPKPKPVKKVATTKEPAPKPKPAKKVAVAKPETIKKTDKAAKSKAPKKPVKAKKANGENPAKPISDL